MLLCVIRKKMMPRIKNAREEECDPKEVMTSVYGIPRFIGLVTVATAVSLPLIVAPTKSLDPFLTSRGREFLAHPLFVFLNVFGTAYASIGDMKISLTFAAAFVTLRHQLITQDDGAFARKFIIGDVVSKVQRTLNGDGTAMVYVNQIMEDIAKKLPALSSSRD